MTQYPNEHILIGSTLDKSVSLAADCVINALETSSQLSNRKPDIPLSVALAGGRTPAALYSRLTQSPYREQSVWRNIEWFWGDERSVPPDHADSNYRMARETLLGPLGIENERIHRMEAERTDRERAAEEYEKAIRAKIPNKNADDIPMLDLVLLGIGADGHTASLFPNSEALKEKQRLVVPNFVPSQQTWRITMTYPLLNAARHIIFLITGADKAPAIEAIFRARSASEGKLMTQELSLITPSPPAAAVHTASGHILWILDAPAARLVATPPIT